MQQHPAIEGFELSPQQRRLWRLLGSADEPLVAQVTVELRGSLDAEAFTGAWARLGEIHESLRTRFVQPHGLEVPLQVVDAAATPEWLRLDLADLASSERRSRLDALALAERHRPRDPAGRSAVRLALVRCAEDGHVLILTLPALNADAESLVRLVAQAATLYGGGVLTETPIQYTQYARLANEMLESEEARAERDHWRRHRPEGLDLRLALERTPLPGAPGPAGRDVAVRRVRLATGTPARVAAVAADRGLSPWSVYLAAWSVLLERHTGATGGLGVACDGRLYDELQDTVGALTRYVPLVVERKAGRGLADLAAAVEEAVTRSYEVQELFDWPGADTGGGPPPWFPFAFDHLEVPEPLRAAELSLDVSDVIPLGDRFTARLRCLERPTDVTLSLDHDEVRLAPEAARHLASQYATLLEAAVAAPDLPVRRLPLAGSAERHRLVSELNRTELPVAGDRPVHRLVEAWAHRAPEATAVVSADGRRMSYGELNRRANRLARHLRAELAVAPEVRVGVFFDRSPEVVVAILAVLKAGGAYVPLVPDYPPRRLTFMVEDSGLRVLITEPRLAGRLENVPGSVVTLGETDGAWAGQSGQDLAEEPRLDHPAYVIYTSGSTGTPKGVVVTHGNLACSTGARAAYYERPVSAFLLLSPVAFDSSVAGLYWTLTQGGTLVLPAADFHDDVDGLLALAATHGVSHLLCLPSLYGALLDRVGGAEAGSAEGAGLEATLAAVVVAGEACPAALVARHADRLPGVTLFNEYGPTEGTVWSSVYDCGAWNPGEEVAIGRRVPGVRLYVLDEGMEPVAVGIAGELTVGGRALARGYLGRPALTAERFVPDPFGDDAGGRLYRTGDRVRFRPTGDLDFAGRLDEQVKIRGHRVELGEVAAAIAGHPAVAEAVVVAYEPETAPPALPHDVQTLARELQALSPERAAELLADVAATAPPDAEPVLVATATTGAAEAAGSRRACARDGFELVLHLEDPRYLAPPREEQREWLLGRLLREAADELEHLAAVSRRFVPGSVDLRLGMAGHDRSDRRLQAEEMVEPWQTPLLQAMAAAVAERHGDVLEIGFGTGRSATFIQHFGVRSHTIVECNRHVIDEFFEPWRREFASADVRLVPARWEDAVRQLGRFDGVLFHAWPLDESEFVERVVDSVTFAEHFFPVAAEHLDPGGVFTYVTHEIDSLGRRHQRSLLQHFSTLNLRVVPLDLPPDVKDLWWADSMAIVSAVK